jgi:toxin FitB
MFLLDTNVVSELRKPRPHGAVSRWVAATPADELFVSAITIQELQFGIERARKSEPPRAQELDAWLERLLRANQIVAHAAACARQAARFTKGHGVAVSPDMMIAATALVHGMTVATPNVRDFATFGAPVFDPFMTN